MGALDDTALVAAAASYAREFGRTPPDSRDGLDRELEELETQVSNVIVAALFSHPYPAFRDAVRRELLHLVPPEAHS